MSHRLVIPKVTSSFQAGIGRYCEQSLKFTHSLRKISNTKHLSEIYRLLESCVLYENSSFALSVNDFSQ